MPLVEAGEYALQLMAAELLTEAAERGDQDMPTVAWVVGRMLQRAIDSEQRRKVTPTMPAETDRSAP